MNARPKNIAVLGAGQIGAIIARMLAEQGHRVTLADASASQLAGVTPGITTEIVDASDLDALRRFLSNRNIVVSALPYFLNGGIARIAVETKTHYFRPHRGCRNHCVHQGHRRDGRRGAGAAMRPCARVHLRPRRGHGGAVRRC